MRFECILLMTSLFLDYSMNVYGDNKTVFVGDTVVLNGCCGSDNDAKWTFEGTIILENQIKLNTPLKDTFELQDTPGYSLNITPVSVFHEGNYKCNCDTVLNYILLVEAIPRAFITVNGSNVTNEISIETDRPVTLGCYAIGAKPSVNLTWKVDDILQTTHITTSINDLGTFDSTATIQFQTSEVETNISCVISEQYITRKRYLNATLITYVTPNVSFSINGNSENRDVSIAHNETLTLICCAIGARPPSNITWFVDDEQVYYLTHGMKTIRTGTTYTSTSVLSIIAENTRGTITCRIIFGYPDTYRDLIRSYNTYVVPTIHVAISGNISFGVIRIDKDQSAIASCRAIGARPAVNLEWLVDDIAIQISGIQPAITSKNSDNNLTYDSVISLTFTPRTSNGNITCVASGLPPGNLYATTLFETKENTATLSSLNKWLIILLSVASAGLLIGVIIYFIRSKIVGGAPSLQSSMYLSPDELSTLNRRSSDAKLPSISSGFIEPLTDDTHSHQRLSRQLARTSSILAPIVEFPKPPNLDLPEIPVPSEIPEYSDVPGDEHAYYSAVKEKATQGRIFYAKDMRLILNMKMGHFYNRWMGTIGASNDKTKCVMITTVSEMALQGKEIHWDDFVKRVLEIPNNRCLPIVQGICIDAAHLYLVQEHFICETLDVRVSQQAADTLNPIMKVSEMEKYILEILEGLEVIHSYGFLHPGLSTRKILLTAQGGCKVYDFCLSEDAVKTVIIKKSKECISLNDFPPESLQRNEYTWASDAWSVAVIIWEILSNGSPPFPIDEQNLDNVIDLRTPRDTWPEQHWHLSNDILLLCWERDNSLRPTISELRSSYIQIFDSPGIITPEHRTSGIMDLYVPMKGGTLESRHSSNIQ